MSKILSIDAKTIFDSRGDLTIEVEILFDSGIQSRASVPQGKSRGKFEAAYLPALKAVQSIKERIYPALRNRDFSDQEELDEILVSLNTGANAVLGVSLAYARAKAIENKIPLWQYIRELLEKNYNQSNRFYKSPRLIVNIIGGGLHAKNNLAFQEYLLIPKTENAFDSLEITKKIYLGVGNYLKERFKDQSLADEGNFGPNLTNNEEPFVIMEIIAKDLGLREQIDFGLDAAANNIKIPIVELFREYKILKQKYNLFYLEDPFSEDNFGNFAKLLKMIGKNTLIVGDDLTVTNIYRMEIAENKKSVNAIVIKPNQIGTLIGTIEAIIMARRYGWAVIVSHRSGETDDSFIADLAYGVGADGFKAGGLMAPERLVKYQRLVEIENERQNK